MSRVYQPKSKEKATVRVVSSEHYNDNRSNLRHVGSIYRGFNSFITTKRNSKTGKCSYIDDTSSLTKKTKNEVVIFFSKKSNKNKGVAYLVTPKK